MNISSRSVVGNALTPQAVNTTKINGETIVKPWTIGRRILFIVNAAAFAASDSITCGIEMRRVGTTTWDTAKEADGTTALAFTAQVDAGALENGFVHGELNLERLQPADSTYEYDAIRITSTNGNAADVIVGATYVIQELYSEQNDTNEALEDLIGKQLWV